MREDSEEGGNPAGGGTRMTAEELAAELYLELRGIARGMVGPKAAGITLQPTAIVHEAYLRMAEQDVTHWENRAHFLAVAARCMRRALVDHVRARSAEKRPSGERRVTLVESITGEATLEVDLLDLERALERLAEVKERYVQVIELRFFAGSSIEETAAALGVTRTVIVRDWAKARAWLRTFLDEEDVRE